MPILGVLLGFVLTLGWLQVAHPMLEHDDWDMLLPDGPRNVLSHTGRLLNEGRWLNYWWWLHGSRDVGPTGAAVLMTAAWGVVATVMTRALRAGSWAVPLGTAAYAAPMATQLRYWPVTLALPTVVLAIGVCAVWASRSRPRAHVAVVAVTAVLLSLAYPPYAVALVPLLVSIHHRATWRFLLVLGMTFGASYVAGIIVVFVLNAIHFGVFGVQPPAWRQPGTLAAYGPVVSHLAVLVQDWWQLARTIMVPLAAAAVALAASRHRGSPLWTRTVVVIAGAALLAGGLDAASTLLSGVSVPVRSRIWVWFALLVALARLVRAAAAPRWRSVAALTVAVATAWTVLYSADIAFRHYRLESSLSRIEDRVVRLDHGHDRRLILESPDGSANPRWTASATVWQLTNALAYRTGLDTYGWCTDNCPSVDRHEARYHPGAVFRYAGAIVIRVPRATYSRYERVTVPSRWLLSR